MKDPFSPREPKITVIGGGTGSFTLLTALKQHTAQLAAIVNMADDGGSTGVLRDELGALPPGDVRQCLVALSESPKIRELFNYRFEDGTFAGHAFGNLFLTALEKTTGSFAEAVETASNILRVNGIVIPATLDDVRLTIAWGKTELVKQHDINSSALPYDPREATLSLSPSPTANPTAIAAIEQADLVVIAPGGLYTSLGPLLVIPGIGEALQQTRAKVVYVCNLVTKEGHTDGFTVADHANEIERFGGGLFLDAVLYNNQIPSDHLLELYKSEHAYLVPYEDKEFENAHYHAISGHFLGDMEKYNPHSVKLPVVRSLIRHNPHAVAAVLMSMCEKE